MFKPLHINSPLITTKKILNDKNKNLYLKLDSSQPSGSFKIRGVGLACQRYKNNGAKMFISSSGGNAGMAVAYSGKKLNIPVTVVVPETTTDTAINLIKDQGAIVIIEGIDVDASHKIAMKLLKKDFYYIHPYDDKHIWEGHSTIVDEILEKNLTPDLIILSVGGGGLLTGISKGLNKHNIKDIPILAVETEGANSFENAYKNNSNMGISSINSIATSLGAKKVSDEAFACIDTNNISCEVVSDYSAVKACSDFYRDFNILVEPACGASLSVLYNNSINLIDKKNILVIVCGGIGVSHDKLRYWEKELRKD